MHVENIANVASYALSMRQSLLDKVFFADKVGPAPAIVDYGCADGQLLKFMRALFPEWPCCGYDISSEMVAAARENNPGVVFDSNWSAIQHAANSFKSDGKQCVLVLSSIVHEVYSYGTSADIEKFWSMVFSGMWDYVVVRDMIPSVAMDRPSDINDVAKVYACANRQQLYDFQIMWGSIENNKNLVHWLLKYRYVNNWQREVKENYMPLYREHLLSALPSEYRVSYHEHYVLPYLRSCVARDFDIDLRDRTHLKLILERSAH